MKRRDFLKKCAVGAGIAAVAPMSLVEEQTTMWTWLDGEVNISHEEFIKRFPGSCPSCKEQGHKSWIDFDQRRRRLRQMRICKNNHNWGIWEPVALKDLHKIGWVRS